MASGDIRRLIDMIKDQDGEGSGLDADLLRQFPASQTPQANTILVSDENGYINDWINQGENSGLDADLLRGLPADFTCSKTESGYTKLPNGLIIQWGLSTDKVVHSNSYTFTFPIAFPNACLAAVANEYGKKY